MMSIALTTNTEDASNGEFSASFSLSNSKGDSLPSFLRIKICSKIHPFQVGTSFEIINFVSDKEKTQEI